MKLQYIHFQEGQAVKGLENHKPGTRVQNGDDTLVSSTSGLGRRGAARFALALWAGAHLDHCHGPAGASPVWGAVEGCRWYPWHSPVSRGAQVLSCMSSCMCWASGMNMHGPTGTAISVSTGMRSFQVSQGVQRPGQAWESMERGLQVWANAQGVAWLFGRVVYLFHHLPVSHGEVRVAFLPDTRKVDQMLLLWALSLHLSTQVMPRMGYCHFSWALWVT